MIRNPNILKSSALDIILAGLFSILFLGFAMYNGYPFITSDTGAYFQLMFDQTVPNDRPRFYSDFMKLFYVRQSFWPIVLVQSALTIWLSLQIMNLLKMSNLANKLIALIFLLLCSQAAWFTSQLMPDFSSAAVLLLLVLYSHYYEGWRAKGLLLLLFLLGIMHKR